MRQLELFTRPQLAAMRDRTAARNYSPEGEKFRREHERHRAWGLKRRHAEKLRRIRDSGRQSPEKPLDVHTADSSTKRGRGERFVDRRQDLPAAPMRAPAANTDGLTRPEPRTSPSRTHANHTKQRPPRERTGNPEGARRPKAHPYPAGGPSPDRSARSVDAGRVLRPFEVTSRAASTPPPACADLPAGGAAPRIPDPPRGTRAGGRTQAPHLQPRAHGPGTNANHRARLGKGQSIPYAWSTLTGAFWTGPNDQCSRKTRASGRGHGPHTIAQSPHPQLERSPRPVSARNPDEWARPRPPHQRPDPTPTTGTRATNRPRDREGLGSGRPRQSLMRIVWTAWARPGSAWSASLPTERRQLTTLPRKPWTRGRMGDLSPRRTRAGSRICGLSRPWTKAGSHMSGRSRQWTKPSSHVSGRSRQWTRASRHPRIHKRKRDRWPRFRS